MIRIFCKNNGETREFQEGTYLWEALESFNFDKPYPILVAKVNNVVEGLKFRVFNNRDVEFMDYSSYAGRLAYSRSLCFLLNMAVQEIFPGSKVTFRRPISKGYFCELIKPDGSEIVEGDVVAIRKKMQQTVLSGMEFHRHEVHVKDAIEMFESIGRTDTVNLLRTCGKVYISYYTLGNTPDIYYDALLPNVSYLKCWSLEAYNGGLFLRIPDRHNPPALAPFIDQPKTFNVLKESLKWNKIMGLSNVGDVNVACMNGGAKDLIQISEALQEKKIVQIAEEIYKRFYSPDHVRVILLTGPTSSGKTTVCKRLSTQLKCCGLHPISFSTDDYFVDRVKTPLLPDGSYDFDNFDTVDHEAMQNDILRLVKGEKIEVPEYNFVTGIREYNGKTMQLGEDSVLLVEGLHALNPKLTDKIPDEIKYKIFINTITAVSLDDHNSISTSDNRLLRRIVRDFNKGAFTARETISHWPNVRRSEVKWIYPYQETADVLFNSSYLVEFAVLRVHAEQILMTVPKDCPEYCEARRLFKFLQYFHPVSDKDVPSTSLLRGFIGGGNL